MALTIESGNITTGADSYTTRADYIAYAAAQGVTIADSSAADEQLVEAFRYINSLESRLMGWRTTKAQASAFPRHDLFIDGYSWNSDEIPRQVITAQMELALDLNAGIDLFNPPQSEAVGIKREKIDGAVEAEYATRDQAAVTRRSASLKALASLMRGGGLMSVSLVMA